MGTEACPHGFGFFSAVILFLALVLTSLAAEAVPSNKTEAVSLLLNTGWMIRSSADANAGGEAISAPAFDTRSWYPARVPTTVLSALAANGVYRDLMFGRNMETVSPEPFAGPWWYRTTFDLPVAARSESVRIILDGVNYSTNIFLNGAKVADAAEIRGAFRRFDLDVTRLARRKGNVLAIEVYPPQPGDLTIGFVDWNPMPADHNMGLWREVRVEASGPVTIEHPFVQSKLNAQSLEEATITVSATLVNHSGRPVSGEISGEIQGGIRLPARPYSLGPKETKEVLFTEADTPGLRIRKPRLWWPNNLGSPELYTLSLAARDGSGVSSSRSIMFGIREVGDYMTEQGYRGYTVNGRKVLIRGGGWVDDMMLNEDPKKLEAQIQYAKHLNLNTIRLEGFWGSSEKLYELADRYGLLVMAGFSCQWEWEDYLGKAADEDFGGIMSVPDMDLAVQYLRDQVLWLRNHPGILVWVVGSDKLPNPELEKRYRSELANLDPSRPILASCKGLESAVSGPTGVKMNGPYEYVPPVYWYVDTENGGAFGFNTETGPGPQPPPKESIQRMFATEHYWPIDDTWNYHCGRHEFNTLAPYMTAFNKRYGEAENFEDFARKAQAANYEAIRPMFEAFGIRKPATTGIIQWMLNASWPKMYWQLYDYYLVPGGAFYGAKKANQPLNIAYDYGDGSIHIINDTYTAYSSLNADVKVLSVESKELFSQTVQASIGPNESRQTLKLPEIKDAPVYFLSLRLSDSTGKAMADNFYWLSAKPDVLDEEKVEWYVTPSKEYADFSALKDMPQVIVQAEQHLLENGMEIVVKNPGTQIAFFIELKLIGDKTGRFIAPVFWDDNYVSLLPGETRKLTVRFSAGDLHGEKPLLLYSGWNVASNR